MKKFLAIFLAVLLLVCMVACKKDETNEDENSNAAIKTDEVMVKDNFKYAVNATGDYEIVGYITDGAEELNVVIPAEIDGRPVTGIGQDAFKALKNLKSFKVADGNNNLKYIGVCAFWGCDGLTEVTIPATVTEIRELAFSGCTNLTTINFSNVLVTIGDYAFAHCDKLTGITLPETLTTIGVGAFFDCDALVNVTIPAAVNDIGKGAFVECKKLIGITFTATDNWFSPQLDAKGEVVLNAKNEIIYDTIAADSINTPDKAAAFLADGLQITRILPKA